MKRQIITLLGLMSLTSWLVSAADIDGKWTAEIAGRGGQVTQTLMLKADGGTLTGSLEGRGGSMKISNGTINGDDVSFSVVREFNGNSMTEQYKGTLSGGELKLTVSGGRRGPREQVFRKAST